MEPEDQEVQGKTQEEIVAISEEQYQNPPELIVSTKGKGYLKQIASWSKFFAILGFISAALMIIVAIIMVFALDQPEEIKIDGYENPYSSYFTWMSAFGAAFSIVYIIFALFYLYPSLKLYQSASKFKAAIIGNDSLLLEEGLGRLKTVFKFWGLVTLIILIFYALFFIGAFVIGIAS